MVNKTERASPLSWFVVIRSLTLSMWFADGCQRLTVRTGERESVRARAGLMLCEQAGFDTEWHMLTNLFADKSRVFFLQKGKQSVKTSETPNAKRVRERWAQHPVSLLPLRHTMFSSKAAASPNWTQQFSFISSYLMCFDGNRRFSSVCALVATGRFFR